MYKPSPQSAIRLWMVTPAYRYWNIGRQMWRYMHEMEPHNLEVRIVFGIQGPERDPKGISKTSEMIDSIKDYAESNRQCWIMMNSDDALHKPPLFRRLEETIRANPQAGVIMFGTERHDGGAHHDANGFCHANPESILRQDTQGMQFVWKKEFLGDQRYEPGHPDDGTVDYRLAIKMYHQFPQKFVFIDEPLTTFNSMVICKPHNI